MKENKFKKFKLKKFKLKKITLSSKVLIIGSLFNLLFLFSLLLFMKLNPSVNSKELKISKIEDVNQSEIKEEYIYLNDGLDENKENIISVGKNISNITNKSISIEKINMFNEPIYEGVDQETLAEKIGHFPFSSDFEGNVCLAAHNYSVKNSNLFKNLVNLNAGDKITYSFNGKIKKYAVKEIYEISSKNLSVLEDTDKNTLTCITCTKNNDKDRRVVLRAEEI